MVRKKKSQFGGSQIIRLSGVYLALGNCKFAPRIALDLAGPLRDLDRSEPMVILVRATARLWAPQALVLATQPRVSSSFQLSRSALHTSAAVRQQQQQRPGPAGGGGGKKRAVQELRPYATVVPAAERLVVIGDVHGDIGEKKGKTRHVTACRCSGCFTASAAYTVVRHACLQGHTYWLSCSVHAVSSGSSFVLKIVYAMRLRCIPIQL